MQVRCDCFLILKIGRQAVKPCRMLVVYIAGLSVCAVPSLPDKPEKHVAMARVF